MSTLAKLCFSTDRKFEKFLRWLKVHRFSDCKRKKDVWQKLPSYMCQAFQIAFWNFGCTFCEHRHKLCLLYILRETYSLFYVIKAEKQSTSLETQLARHILFLCNLYEKVLFIYIISVYVGIKPEIIYPLKERIHVR